jgi:hypothetical protein
LNKLKITKRGYAAKAHSISNNFPIFLVPKSKDTTSFDVAPYLFADISEIFG